MKSQDIQLFKRALAILHSTSLQRLVQIQNVINSIKKYAKNLKFIDIMFYFPKQGKYWKMLGDQLCILKNNEADKIVLDILYKYGLQSDIFPQLLFNIQKKGIRYNYKSNPLYVCEAKFMSNKKYLSHIVLLLTDEKRLLEAKSLMVKYNLFGESMLKQVMKELQDVPAKAIRNRLLEYDDFGATELRVLKTLETQYLQLMDFGVEERDVIWVDSMSSNLNQASDILLYTKHLGFDAQMSGGIHVLQKGINQILQIATINKVFVFDIKSLSGNKQFQALIQKLFYENEDQIMIGHSCSSDMKTIQSIVKTTKKAKDIIDTQKLYQRNHPISLKDLVEEQFNKPLSKFQQCSGWNNRPLRRAQLHYAALDALVLVRIYTKATLLLERGK